jgi:hypothetical protein
MSIGETWVNRGLERGRHLTGRSRWPLCRLQCVNSLLAYLGGVLGESRIDVSTETLLSFDCGLSQGWDEMQKCGGRK